MLGSFGWLPRKSDPRAYRLHDVVSYRARMSPNRMADRVRRNSIKPLSSRQGMRVHPSSSTSQLANALAFMSRSTSA
jgi:hypothetical protein